MADVPDIEDNPVQLENAYRLTVVILSLKSKEVMALLAKAELPISVRFSPPVTVVSDLQP